MTPEQARLAEDIFAEACDLPPDQRAEFVQAKCAGQPPDIGAYVNELLAASEEAGESFLNPAEIRRLTMVGKLEQDAAEDEAALPPGTRLGEYTLEGVLGAGGMGVVYVARQERPRRTVALKVIRRGLGTTGLLRRFEHEAEMLARLQHPGIAQVYAAGSADVHGERHPYIAMEYVQGPPLTDFAERAKLGTKARLDLLARVCDAVHHAHQRGIIHRDLKPANILVNAEGQPKVLDFGVARAADASVQMTALRTGVGQLIGTLAYMSPEQVVGDPAEIDTRSDVYALGVVMYQVLTGKLPHAVGTKSLPEAVRAIRDEEPERLSRVSKVFRGEIDTIVAKALEKDKARRYQSAAELAEDLRRYLAGEPILATRDTMYLLGKRLSRYRWAVGGACAAALGLAGFAVYASWQAEANRRLAESEGAAKIRADEALTLADRRATELEEALYQSRIGFAQAAVAGGDLLRAADQLDRCRPEDRGWEWHHIRYRCDQSTAQVTLAWEPRFADVSADGRVLYTTDTHGVLRATNALTGEVRRVFESDAKHMQVALSPDESRVACTIYQGGVDIFDTVTGARVQRIEAPAMDSPFVGLYRVAWVDGGRAIFAAALRRDVFVFDASTGALQRQWKAAESDIFDLDVTDDGRIVATASTDGGVRMWDPRTGTLVANLKPDGQAVRVVFSPDGSVLAVGLHQMRVLLWTWRGEGVPRELRGLDSAPFTMSFSRDGAWFVASQRDPTLQCWDVASGAMRWRRRTPVTPSVAMFPTAAGEGVVAMGRDAVLRTWHLNPRPPAPALHVGTTVLGQAPRPDRRGVFVFARDGTIYDVDQVSLHATPRPTRCPPDTRGVFPAAGGLVCGVTDRGTVWTWDGEAPEIVPFEVFPQGHARAAVSADGRRLAIQDMRAGVTVVDLAARAILTTFETGIDTLGGLAWTPDGDLFIGHARSSIGRWSVAGAFLGPRITYTDIIQEFALSPDGRLLIGATMNGELRFWNAISGMPSHTTVNIGAQAMSVAFMPDGSRFVTSHADRTVRVWDAARCEELASLLGHTATPFRADVLPDGPTLVTADIQGMVRFWETRVPASGP
ncbi:MAG: hypothetical protein HBSAPP03_19640 [Phycisphaerae bacterium]|nr:MAG: hypothetical protein HBSAPP03_19640 [Phycisphaerae bacterium]